MTLSRTLSAALLAAATLAAAVPAPALALVPGSEHYRQRGEEVERQAVAAGTAARPASERAGTLGGSGTFGYALAPRGGGAPAPINNNHYRDRADEQSRQQIQAR